MLKSPTTTPEKRDYYFTLVEQNIENVESALERLKVLQSGIPPLAGK